MKKLIKAGFVVFIYLVTVSTWSMELDVAPVIPSPQASPVESSKQKLGDDQVAKALQEISAPHPDWMRIKKLLQMAADQENVIGEELLGGFYAKDTDFAKRGGDRDLPQAISLFEKAIEHGGKIYSSGSLSVLIRHKDQISDQEINNFKQWLEKRALSGDQDAANGLASLFASGELFPKNIDAATAYYAIAKNRNEILKLKINGSTIKARGWLRGGYGAFGGETTGWIMTFSKPMTLAEGKVLDEIEVEGKLFNHEMSGKYYQIIGHLLWVNGVEVRNRIVLVPDKVKSFKKNSVNVPGEITIVLNEGVSAEVQRALIKKLSVYNEVVRKTDEEPGNVVYTVIIQNDKVRSDVLGWLGSDPVVLTAGPNVYLPSMNNSERREPLNIKVLDSEVLIEVDFEKKSTRGQREAVLKKLKSYGTVKKKKTESSVNNIYLLTIPSYKNQKEVLDLLDDEPVVEWDGLYIPVRPTPTEGPEIKDEL